MVPYKAYRLRCTVDDDCGFAHEVRGPDTDARSPVIWVLFRAHCDLQHRGTKPLTAIVANMTDPEDYAELVL